MINFPNPDTHGISHTHIYTLTLSLSLSLNIFYSLTFEIWFVNQNERRGVFKKILIYPANKLQISTTISLIDNHLEPSFFIVAI